ncbi:MAG: Ig-like domain-containing protein, partial [Acidimicrobiales bacterium]
PGSTPTGTVTIKAPTGTLCVITLSSGKGSCRLSPKKLDARTYSLVATYGGSTNFKGSTSVKTITVAD